MTETPVAPFEGLIRVGGGGTVAANTSGICALIAPDETRLTAYVALELALKIRRISTMLLIKLGTA